MYTTLLCALGVLATAAAHGADDNSILFTLTDEEYYSMPELFVLQDRGRCLALHGTYCLGSFQLASATSGERLYTTMERYSANWVDNFNHTRLHRGLCLSTACDSSPHLADQPSPPHTPADQQWFASCVNATMSSQYNLSARPLVIEYCETEAAAAATSSLPTSADERAFAAFSATLLALAALSTALDVTLPDHTKKGAWCSVALSWSIRGSWRALQGTARRSGGHVTASTDLRALDGLRVLCMCCVVIEHVCWLGTQHYVQNTREYELMRRSWDAMLAVNSTLVVQIFFLMSSFLLAHKLLQPASLAEQHDTNSARIFADTMLNRIVRVSPAYWLVVWWAASGWARLGSGPLWAPLVGAEVGVCRRKWWTHLLYLNNVVYPDDKCLIQTWYLAADMQLYAVCLLLTLSVRGWPRRHALLLLSSLLAAALTTLTTLAYTYSLLPTSQMHNPELVRRAYSGDSSFNMMYQSPLANTPGALAGLLLAFTHRHLLDTGSNIHENKIFRWVCAWSPWLGVVWAGMSPRLVGAGPPARAPAAALAATERTVFAAFVALGLLGAMHHVKSPLRSVLSWRRWAVPARLSFGVLLLHMPLNKALVASRAAATTLNRTTILVEWLGVLMWSYALALPLVLLVEIPAQRLQRALQGLSAKPRADDGPDTHKHTK